MKKKAHLKEIRFVFAFNSLPRNDVPSRSQGGVLSLSRVHDEEKSRRRGREQQSNRQSNEVDTPSCTCTKNQKKINNSTTRRWEMMTAKCGIRHFFTDKF